MVLSIPVLLILTHIATDGGRVILKSQSLRMHIIFCSWWLLLILLAPLFKYIQHGSILLYNDHFTHDGESIWLVIMHAISPISLYSCIITVLFYSLLPLIYSILSLIYLFSFLIYSTSTPIYSFSLLFLLFSVSNWMI